MTYLALAASTDKFNKFCGWLPSPVDSSKLAEARKASNALVAEHGVHKLQQSTTLFIKRITGRTTPSRELAAHQFRNHSKERWVAIISDIIVIIVTIVVTIG